MLLLRFLGPFEAPAGETSVFCWRLERPQGTWAAAEEGSQELRYEVSAVHGSWDPAGVRKGRVLLGRAPGSVATVEAAFTPRALGRLACPRLVLHGVHSQVRVEGVVCQVFFTAAFLLAHKVLSCPLHRSRTIPPRTWELSESCPACSWQTLQTCLCSDVDLLGTVCNAVAGRKLKTIPTVFVEPAAGSPARVAKSVNARTRFQICPIAKAQICRQAKMPFFT